MKAFVAKDSTHINSSAKSVWDVLSDFHNVDKWAERALTVETVGEIVHGLGISRRVKVKGIGWIEEIVTIQEENKSFGYTVSPIGPIDESFSLWVIDEVETKSCRVSLRLSYNMKLGWIGHLLHTFIIRKKITSRLPVILSALKHYVETGTMLHEGRT